MNKNQRKKEILEALNEADFKSIQELADIFDVSLNTIRRDINELSDSGHINKFYGGVSLALKSDSAYDHRVLTNLNQKIKIAQFAASLVEPNDLIFIDSGSTTPLILDYLDPNINLTIVSNNLHVFTKLINHPNWDLIVMGSQLNHSTHSLTHVQNLDYLYSLNLDKAFMATTGLTIKSGATNPLGAESVIKESMMACSKKSYLLMDSSKFDQTSLLTFSKIDGFTQIITTGDVPRYYIDYFEKNNINMIIL